MLWYMCIDLIAPSFPASFHLFNHLVNLLPQ